MTAPHATDTLPAQDDEEQDPGCYAILSNERMALGMRVRRTRALELVDKYSPTSIMPEDWPDRLGLRITGAYCTHVACEEMRG